MPKFKETKEETRLSNPGAIISSGTVTQSDLDTTTWQEMVSDITKMVNGDCISNSCLESQKLPIIASDWKLDSKIKSNKTKEIEDYFYWCLNNLTNGFQYFKIHLLTNLNYGFSLFEKQKQTVLYNNKPTQIYKTLSPISPDTVYRWEYEDLKTDDWTGINHIKRIPNRGQQYINIPREKLFLCSFRSMFGNLSGSPILRPARNPWAIKKDVLRAIRDSSIRGPGIPHMTYAAQPNMSPSDISKAEQVCRTIMNSPYSYFSDQEGKYKIVLESIKGLEFSDALLNYLDKQMMFLTASQWSSVGVNGAGSFAASTSVRSLYELAVQSIITDIENFINQLIIEMKNISSYAYITQEEIPTIKFTYGGFDVKSAIANITSLYTSNIITKQPTDEAFWRSQFGMPEAIEIKTSQGNQNIVNTDNQNLSMTKLSKVENKYRELSDHEKNILSFDSAKEHYETISEKANKITQEVFSKILKDVAKQVNEGKSELTLGYKQELINRLSSLYKTGLDRGRNDMQSEYNKVRTSKSLSKFELADKINVVKKFKNIERRVDVLYTKTKATLEDIIDRETSEVIQKKGTLEFFMKYENQFEKDKNAVNSVIEKSYNEGRGEIIQEVVKNQPEQMWRVSSIFDINLCSTCASYDSLDYKSSELEENGISLNGDTIHDCEGHLQITNPNTCRCILMPI